MWTSRFDDPTAERVAFGDAASADDAATGRLEAAKVARS
jgi:hypothetical protein